MRVQSMHFQARAGQKLSDARLQQNLKKLADKFVTARSSAMQEIDFPATRQAAIERRNRVLDRLDVWIEMFEDNARARGTTVLFAETPAQASELVVAIAKKHDVKRVTKSKSMVSEEMALNAALERAGIESIETDLGEYILQINNNEAPSHIIAPVIHKDKEEISDLFAKVHGKPRLTDIPQLTREARETLRPKFLSSDMGVTGGNFLIAETGSVGIVTNEGNEGMCTVMPRVHVAVTGIEKILPTFEDFATMIRLLTRSATGQSISNYISLLTGVRAPGEPDGPEHMYVVLVDGGRSSLMGSEFQEMLRCIRCGACMNHCPVYQKIGGHAYGWVYPGPMGSVLTPNYVGLENALDLPQAATMCGECHVVCPVGIPLPDLLRKLRERQFDRHLRPATERITMAIWGFVAVRPQLYALFTGIANRVLRGMGRRNGRISHLRGAKGWTDFRDLATPSSKTFRELYADRTALGLNQAVARTDSPTSSGPR
jgi:L-lactate dehydrogenase complex protein LldF